MKRIDELSMFELDVTGAYWPDDRRPRVSERNLDLIVKKINEQNEAINAVMERLGMVDKEGES
jgi:RimJ/RimL family protein N-acetyltransferase